MLALHPYKLPMLALHPYKPHACTPSLQAPHARNPSLQAPRSHSILTSSPCLHFILTSLATGPALSPLNAQVHPPLACTCATTTAQPAPHPPSQPSSPESPESQAPHLRVPAPPRQHDHDSMTTTAQPPPPPALSPPNPIYERHTHMHLRHQRVHLWGRQRLHGLQQHLHARRRTPWRHAWQAGQVHAWRHRGTGQQCDCIRRQAWARKLRAPINDGV